MQKSHPNVVNPRDIAGECKKKKKKKKKKSQWPQRQWPLDRSGTVRTMLWFWTCKDNHFIIMMTAVKGIIRDFDNLLTAPRTVSNMYAQVAKAHLCANHVQHIKPLSRATCHILAVFYWLNHQPMEEGRKLEHREKTPDDELQKMPQTKAQTFKS